MRKRIIAGLIAILAALPMMASAQGTTTPSVKFAILASNFDLDGEAADAAQDLAATQVADSTSYTIAAQPDTCRAINITIVDADSSMTVGTFTVDGTDCWGRPQRATFNMAGGSGIRTGALATYTVGGTSYAAFASGPYFATLTTISNGVVTGEGGAADTVSVGYAGINSAASYPMYGVYKTTPSGRRRVDPFDSYDVRCLIKNGAATTDVVGVSTATTACFQNVSVGDLLVLNIAGEVITRKVATRADADTITVNSGVTIPTAGVNFFYKKFWLLTDPIDGWIPVQGWDVVDFAYEVDANVATGGVTFNLECAAFLTSDPPNSEVEITKDSTNVGTGTTGEVVKSIDLRLEPHYTHCRLGMKFGTGDDGDGANEDIDAVIGLRR